MENKKTMIKRMPSIIVISSLLSFHLYAADAALESESSLNGSELRKAILEQVSPHLKNLKPHGGTPSFGPPVVSYESEECCNAMLGLLAKAITTETKPDEAMGKDYIARSLQLRTGKYVVEICNDQRIITTGNVCECVAIIVRNKSCGLVAMYHYFQRDDRNYDSLQAFLNEVTEVLETQQSDRATSEFALVSSYLSPNLIIINNFLKEHGFNATIHASKRVHLRDSTYVMPSQKNLGKVGKLVVVGRDLLEIYDHKLGEGNYDADLREGDEEGCSIM